MIIEIKIPSPGESITEVEVSSWLVNNGDFVEKDQEIAEIESDKATLPLMAEESGKINILAETGKVIGVGEVACTIDTEAKGDKSSDDTGEASSLPVSGKAGREQPEKEDKTATNSNKDEPVPETGQASSLPFSGKAGQEKKPGDSGPGPEEGSTEEKPNKESLSSSDGSVDSPDDGLTDESKEKTTGHNLEKIKISPLARKLMEDKNLSVEEVIGRLERITRSDVEAAAGMKDPGTTIKQEQRTVTREFSRKRMSVLRRKLSTRLVAVKNETAMLTTFNEVDMSRIIDIRKNNQSRFVEKHGIKLGFMSFFAKAVTETLRLYTNINSYIDGDDIITPEYVDIGIAVQTDKGLMVPVMRNTEIMGLADIEKRLAELAGKARKNRITIEEMSGGTFTITNGGIFGSLLSTPILNPPQSAILGMHNIVERPVAIKGKVEIRPMMYIALSYDHRIIDGRDSVGFLVKIKELLEDPGKMLFEGKDPGDLLLGL